MDGVPTQLTVDPNTGWLLWLQSTEAGGSAVFGLALSGPSRTQHAEVDTSKNISKGIIFSLSISKLETIKF